MSGPDRRAHAPFQNITLQTFRRASSCCGPKGPWPAAGRGCRQTTSRVRLGHFGNFFWMWASAIWSHPRGDEDVLQRRRGQPTNWAGREAGAARRPPSVETIKSERTCGPTTTTSAPAVVNFPRGQRVADDRRGSGPRPGFNPNLIHHISFDLDAAVLELARAGPMPRDLSLPTWTSEQPTRQGSDRPKLPSQAHKLDGESDLGGAISHRWVRESEDRHTFSCDRRTCVETSTGRRSVIWKRLSWGWCIGITSSELYYTVLQCARHTRPPLDGLLLTTFIMDASAEPVSCQERSCPGGSERARICKPSTCVHPRGGSA